MRELAIGYFNGSSTGNDFRTEIKTSRRQELQSLGARGSIIGFGNFS